MSHSISSQGLCRNAEAETVTTLSKKEHSIKSRDDNQKQEPRLSTIRESPSPPANPHGVKPMGVAKMDIILLSPAIANCHITSAGAPLSATLGVGNERYIEASRQRESLPSLNNPNQYWKNYEAEQEKFKGVAMYKMYL